MSILVSPAEDDAAASCFVSISVFFSSTPNSANVGRLPGLEEKRYRLIPWCLFLLPETISETCSKLSSECRIRSDDTSEDLSSDVLSDVLEKLSLAFSSSTPSSLLLEVVTVTL